MWFWGQYITFVHSIEYSNFPGAGDVWFSLNGTTYQNNSCVALEDIGEGNNNSLLCVTNQTACCRPPYTDQNQSAKGNNSCVALEDIGERNNNSLLCVTNQTACCRPPYTDQNQSAKGNWYLPNGTRVLSQSEQSDFYRTRDQMMVRLNRRQGGEDGIYRCQTPDSMNVTQNIYIGVYSACTSK